MGRAYDFAVDGEARAFCDQIVEELRALGIDEGEALGRLNRQWAGMPFEDDDLRYYAATAVWARIIYYGQHSLWWRSPPGLAPLPYP